MSTDASASSRVPAQATAPEIPVALEEVSAAEPAAGPLVGDPLSLGLPTFIVGSIALGLALAGVWSAASVGAALPIILMATGIGLLLSTIWAAGLGQSVVASILGTFSGFWLSYAVLVLGLDHNWYGVTATSVQATEELFLVSWMVIVLMFTLATLRLPLAFTALLALVFLALLLVFLGIEGPSTGTLQAGGYVILVFAALGAYLFTSTIGVATGGAALPLGRPVIH
jgi:hypothetical protein